jgi:hypothetical protein
MLFSAMAVHSFFFTLLIMANGILAGDVVPRQATTTSTSTTAGPSSALIETTISGKLTTVAAGPPTAMPSHTLRRIVALVDLVGSGLDADRQRSVVVPQHDRPADMRAARGAGPERGQHVLG